ncbi:MAG: CvpA family protein [Terracidiphilus sp.]
MGLVDGAIVMILALAVFGGLVRGFFRSFCALAGLLLGLSLGAWHYGQLAALLLPVVKIRPVANTLGFLAIALVTMGIVGMLGSLLSRTFHSIGLGCVDRLAGAFFGLFQGALLVTLAILVTLAFFPSARWLTEARLPRYFFGACHLSTRMSPADLAERIRLSLMTIKQQSPQWLHLGAGGF